MYSLSHAVTVVSPIILLLAIGKGLTYTNLIDDQFVKSANKLAYNFFLPILLFNAVSQANMSALFDGSMMLSGLIGTAVAFFVFVVASQWFGFSHFQRGVVIQGSFRANMGIIGLALCGSLLGDNGLALASVYLGMIVPLFNVLSVWVLVLFSSNAKRHSDILIEVAKSPLVIAVALALPLAIWSVPKPFIIEKTASLLSQVTLPLALLCIGASLVFREFRSRWKPLSFILLGKALIYPCLVLCAAFLFNVQGDALIVLAILSLAPTATASFPAVQQLGGDAALAADAVALSTVLSLPLYMLVIWLL